MKKLGLVLTAAFCLAVMGGVAQSQVLMVEHFNYATGSLPTVSSSAWVAFSGTTSPQVSAGSLSYPNYVFSPGNKVDIASTAGEDDHLQFATQGVGTTTYAAFLVNVANTTALAANSSATGDYFAGFLPSTSVTFLVARVSIRTGSVAGTFQLGLRATSTNATASFSLTDLTPGTTNLVVISYQVVAGNTNDPVNMWINPPLGGSQPAADLNQTSATVTDNVDTARFFFRQGANSGNASFDTIRIGSTWSDVASSPTAADGMVSGRIEDTSGAPIAGSVVRLTGTQNRKTITDANGNYRFDNVETNGFYTVAPTRTNFSFSPAERSFSQVGNSTEATFTGSPVAGENPLDTPEYFVRQHYLDFLGREPDESGFNFWSDQILECGNDADCIERRTVNVSAAYFLSVEFQRTGGLVDRLYRASYGRSPLYTEFMTDRATIARGVVVGRSGWQQLLAANEESFVDSWAGRAAFHAAFDSLANDDYVDALVSNTGVNFTQTERDSLVSGLSGGSLSRASVLQQIANNDNFARARFNEAFVMMEYFGYLGRDPDASGYAFWLNKLNEFNGNFERAEMVKAFIDSGEYRARFQR